MSSRSRQRIALLLPTPLVVLVALAACATGLTLSQELAWERWKKCDHFANIRLKEIRPDGQIWVTYSDVPHDLPAYQECLRQAAAEQAKKPVKVGQTVVASTIPATLPSGAPNWRPGDEWAFRWESPRGQGTFVWKVDRVETLAGTEFYVIKSGRYESYWRRSDIAFYMDRQSGREFELRFTPPQSAYTWPLLVGRSWEQTYTVERATGRPTEATMSCTVLEQEKIAVTAGVFDTFRIECRNKSTKGVMFRRWYSPAAKNYVKEESVFDYGTRVRELIGMRVPQVTWTASTIPDASVSIVLNEAETARSLREAAEAGDPRAMAKLGFRYFAGRGGVPKDDLEAVRWFRKGAEAGDGLAMAFLGASYSTGLGGLARDETEAVRWFAKGAGAGNGRAMAMLGQMSLTGGGGLARNEAEGVRWFRKGAEAGDARAMAMLGEMYLTGEGGLAKDTATAGRWIRRAADAGDGYAMATLGSMHETGEGGLAKDDSEAVRWYRRGVEVGNGRAMAGLGGMYSTGRGGLRKNPTDAVQWYREGANLLDAAAMFQLGQAYEEGQGVPRDPQEAVRWYRKSASFGFPDAFDRLLALGE
jgi:TPR repeat protein